MTDIAFFITGMGRSGTMWLAQLLDESGGVKVYHEALKRGVKILEKGYKTNRFAAVDYLKKRKMEMVPPEGQRWGEVNSYLRYWVEPLREVFPDVPILGLVRDGKKTVASLIRRGVYGVRDRRNLPIPPDDADTQFAKCCWLWADVYERLLEQEVDIFTLESLNESYGACETLCEELGIKPIDEEVWHCYAGQHIHNDVRARFQAPWDSRHHAMFKVWAGSIYQEVGYADTD
jgi:hypothetical protein